jgi:hypothetical protein
MDFFDILLARRMGGRGGTTNYNALSNKPKINSVELTGDKSSSDLGLQDVLTSAQLEAVNSGITAAKVGQYNDIYAVMNYSNLNHNVIFRGKDLTNVYTIEQMYDMIHSGKFDDLFLGDYFTKSITTDIYTKFTDTEFAAGTTYYERSGADLLNWTYTETSDAAYDSSKTYYTKLTKTENVTLMFAAFDYYYQMGDTACTTHHAILIPRNYGFATVSKMNPTNTTVGGYYNTEMHQTTLPCYAKSLKTALNNHLLSHRTILSNTVNTSTLSMAGAGFTGASTNWAWVTTELQLMTEQQVYGTRAWTSSAYDIGVDYRILPVFNFINPVLFGRNAFWLRSVVSSTNFAHCTTHGYANYNGASSAVFVRPLILFG